MKNIFIYFIMLMSTFCIGQNISSTKGFSIGLAPLNLLEPVTNTFEIVGEYNIDEKYSIEIKVGLPVGQFFNLLGKNGYWKYMYESGNYYELKAGIKRSILSVRFSNLYIGAEINYLNSKYNINNDWYFKNNEYFSFDSAKVKRTAIGLGFFLGRKFSLSKWVIGDFSTGIGFRNMKYDYNTINEGAYEPFTIDRFPFVPRAETFKYHGSKIKPYLIYSFRLMYKLTKS